MRHSRPALFAIIAAVLLLSSLACRTLLGEPEATDFADEVVQDEVVQSEPLPAPTKFSPTNTPLPIPTPSARLDGSELPNLTFDPPGFSPYDPGRPQLSGDPQSLGTAHFRIHYTLSGEDAVPTRDENGNGHPDYVEEVARALEYSWFALIEHFGWFAPPADAGLGGDDRYDIYLDEAFDEGTAGYVESDYEGGFFGDNPNSPQFEQAASSSYMVLDDDYAGYEDDPAPGVSTIDFMRSTAAHEFLHMVQYGYDADEPHDWLWEASATWVQDEVFNLVNDGNENLPAVFKAPDSCQLAYGGEDRVEDVDHWYGMWIFIRFLSERYGHESVRAVWEASIDLDGYDAWDRVLADVGVTLEALFRDFSVALLTRDFEEGGSYPVVRLEGETGVGEVFTPLDGVAQMAVDYIEIFADQVIDVELDQNKLDGLLIGVNEGEASLFPMEAGSVSVDASLFQHLYLAVLNLNRANQESNCSFTTYSVAVFPGNGSGQAPASVLPAGNFLAPRVESLMDPELYFED